MALYGHELDISKMILQKFPFLADFVEISSYLSYLLRFGPNYFKILKIVTQISVINYIKNFIKLLVYVVTM